MVGRQFRLPTIRVASLFVSFTEQQGDAPKTCQANKGINDSAENGCLAAEDPCHQIKFGKADQAPVDRTDNGENQSDGIHVINSISFGFYQCNHIETHYTNRI